MRLAVTLLLGSLVACAPPGKDAAQAYVTSLQPLLLENGKLADALIQLAGSDPPPAELFAPFAERLVPGAEHLAWQAGALPPPPAPWSDRHLALVRVWGDRARAWRGLADSVQDSQRDAWKQAAGDASKAQLAEEAWFEETNQALRPFGLWVDAFP